MARESIEVTRMHGAKQAFGETRSANFGKAAEAAPFTLRTLGLGSGLATLAAKGEENKKLAAMICRWILDDCPHVSLSHADIDADAGDDDWIRAMLAAIASWNRGQYRTAQIEAMGYVGWIKKLAQAFCPQEEE